MGEHEDEDAATVTDFLEAHVWPAETEVKEETQPGLDDPTPEREIDLRLRGGYEPSYD